MPSPVLRYLLLLSPLLLVGCSPKLLPGDYGPNVQFKDDVSSNAPVERQELTSIELTSTDGRTVKLIDFVGRQKILLVVSRGVVGSATVDDSGEIQKHFCIYCSTQTSRLIANYNEFKRRDTEVVLVFPVARSQDATELQRFAAKVQGPGKTTLDIPFPVLLDVELHAVDSLGIRDDLSKPSTYILDSDGQIRFAYVGQAISDRPSIKALLGQLDRIE